jgi:ABC-type Fe3+/spermidine/putrescine transport system ATPase subunit
MPAEPPAPALALRSASKRYGDVAALDDVSLEVQQGEFLAIIGPSGSGKTTLLRVVAGFESPDAGRIELSGRDVTAVPPEHRDVSTVFQSYALFPHLTVRDNVAFGLRMRGVGRTERLRRAEEMLDLVHLPGVAGRHPQELSGGQQQRVALARAIANAPALLLFDEPLGALDRKLRVEMQGELRRIHRELGGTFVYITHDQEEAFGMADRLAVLRSGRIVQLGGPAEVYDHPVDAWTALFVGEGNTVPGRLADGGLLETDLGPVRSTRPTSLVPGDRGVAVVRPEATRIEADSPGAQGIPARVLDVLPTGPQLQVRAETAGGVVLVSRVPRGSGPTVTPGDPVRVVLDPASVALFAPPSTPL